MGVVPRRDDIESILIIGSGPIVIGQACEFDYSGTQACRVLRAEGYRVILANSNPATIMTDPQVADATYVEPLDAAVLARIVERERPDAVLPTLGGQTGLNLAMELVADGVLEAAGAELIGADADAIATAEDRQLFKQAMVEIGLDVPRSGIARNMDEARRVLEEVGLPVIVRPAYILGGRGAGIAATAEEFEQVAAFGLEASPVSEILIEESIVGWKEFELEVMRDRADNCVVVCSIENLDPMGVHTGDSITVAPAQTLSDPEYQQMRDAAFAVLRRVGVETGGSNVQFAVDPATGRQVVIEMNPRVSRSSALASKATGFPIAKIAARLAVGYTLDEIPNDITEVTPASFEPTLDYVVTKIPRWAFEKFQDVSGVLGTSMQSVGEVMAIGRTFCESLQKGLRSGEQGRPGPQRRPGRGRPRPPRRRRAAGRGGGPHRRAHLPDGGAAAPGRDGGRPVGGHWRGPLVPRPDRPHHRGAPGAGGGRTGGHDQGRMAPGQAPRVLRRPDRLSVGHGRRRCAGAPGAGRGSAHVQDGGHLRGRVRGVHAVPLLHLRGRRRDPAGVGAPDRDLRVRAPTASGRASSSTTAASMRARRCGPPGTRR